MASPRSCSRAALAGVLLIGLLPTASALAADEEPAVELETTVVVGSRVAEPLQQVVGSVSVVTREALEQHGVADIGDLAARIPGVTVSSDAGRFGQLGFNVRGMDGNRVSIELDGVPLPDAFAVGDFALAGRDLVDLAVIERVEVLRGPASTLHGSKALGGIVRYATRAPVDFLWDRDGQAAGFTGGVSSRDRSHHGGGHLAFERGAWSALLTVARRRGHETDAHAPPGALRANPARFHRDSVLAKLVHGDSDGNHWIFTWDRAAGRRRSEVRSLLGTPPRYETTTALDGDDRWRRERLSAKAQWIAPLSWLDSAELLLYRQRATTRQLTHQERSADAATPWPTRRDRSFTLGQDSLGLRLVTQARGHWLGLEHWQVAGVDLARQDYRGLRRGSETNLDTGAAGNVILGEVFPVRDFPVSRGIEAALFWQDEIRLGERWAVVPGWRLERQRLRARPDAIWLADNPDTPAVDVASTRGTPKLGLRFQPSARDTLHAQIVDGYRAPPFSDVNIGLYLPLFNYAVRPNPALRPERSRGVELGWRHHGPTLDASVAVYHNRFRDLIDSRANLGVDPATGTLVFQSVNRDRARIRGVEAELRWRPAALGGWQASLAGSAARGEDTVRNQPLNSVQPARLQLGAGWDDWRGRGAEVTLTGVRAVTRSDDSETVLYRPGGWARLDASLWWTWTGGARLQLTLGNLANRRYVDWAAVAGVARDAPDLGLWYAPGRWGTLNFSYDWR